MTTAVYRMRVILSTPTRQSTAVGTTSGAEQIALLKELSSSNIAGPLDLMHYSTECPKTDKSLFPCDRSADEMVLGTGILVSTSTFALSTFGNGKIAGLPLDDFAALASERVSPNTRPHGCFCRNSYVNDLR